MPSGRMLGCRLGAAAFAAASTAGAEPLVPAGEATIDRVRRTGVLRIAALPGEMPFFRTDLTTGEWSGVAIEMAKSIATSINARLAYIESIYANSVLDLQPTRSILPLRSIRRPSVHSRSGSPALITAIRSAMPPVLVSRLGAGRI